VLRIHLFGVPHLTAGGEALKFAARPRSWPLLGYLLLHRQQAVPREPVAYLLWPDDTEEEARANLRRHLNEIHKNLPPESAGRPWIVTEGATIRFNPDAEYWLDIAEFERLGGARDTLAAAADLYAGDLLENVTDEWIYAERERFRSAYLTMLGQLIQAQRGNRDYAKAAAYAEQLLVHDSLREDAARQLIALHYEAGDRAGALQAFDRFARRLREELDVDPMPETVALRDAILRNAAIPGISEAAPVDGRPATRSFPLVGRETEIEVLRSWWSRAARGRGQAVLVGGEAGIGKSRLVSEFALVVQAQGGRVLTGGTAFAEASPYQSIAEAVRSALPLVASLALDPIRMAALGQLVPELRASLDGTTALAPLETEREQTRLFDALAACLEALAAPRPVLLVLEDLHWAGAATAAAFEFLAHRCAQRPLLIVATYRDEETPRAHPLRDVRRRLQQEKSLTHISLSRLPLEAVEALVRHVPELKPELRELAQHLYFESEGNPFFLGEVIRDLVEAGPASVPSEKSVRDRVPTTVQATIFARVARLTDRARSLAEVAAVIGRAFDVELLREVCGWEEGEILDGLSELLDRHLVREIGGRTHVDYAFTHHLIQSAIYDSSPQESRKLRHRRIAHVKEELDAAKVFEIAGELALHYDRGGEPERAASYYLKAAKRALEVFAVDEALDYLDRGLELATALDLRAELLVLRAEIRRHRGERIKQREDLDELERVADARGDDELSCEVLRRRIHLARALGERDAEAEYIVALKSRADHNGSLRWQAKALQAEAMHMALVGGFGDAMQTMTRALALHRKVDDPSGQLECLCLLAEMTARRGVPAETQAILREARLCAQGVPDPGLIARTTIAAARAATIRQDYPEAQVLAQAALDQYRTVCDREGEADALFGLAGASIGLWRFDEARLYHAQALEIYRAIGHRRGMANVTMDAAIIESGLGLIVEAEESIRKATALFETLKDLRGMTLCALYLSDFRRNSGDTAGAKASALRALELARRLQIPTLEAMALGNLGDAERDAGDIEESIAHLETAVTMLRSSHSPLDFVEVLAGLALAHLRARDLGKARAAVEELLTHDVSIDSAHRPQYCRWMAAQVLRACGEIERARAQLQHAHDVVARSAAAIIETGTKSAYLGQRFNLEIVAAQERDIWPTISA
jgi:DNA-binding SARP family transcriptional activator/tetratricopeptide (TPR) repeat protein